MPILDPHTLEFLSRSPEQTRRVGMRIGALLQTGDVIALEGDLGSGKTTLIQGVAAGWGTLDPVTSPTFVLVNLYRRFDGGQLFHLDAFRLQKASEAEELDLRIMLESGSLVVEWADHIQEAIPPAHLWIGLRWMDDQQRSMRISARGRRYETMLSSLRHVVLGVR